MGKNDFDVDFDFEEEFGFDPKAFLGTEEYDEDIDLSVFTDEELGLAPEAAPANKKPAADPADEFDLGGLDLGDAQDADEDLDLDELLGLRRENAEADAPSEADFSDTEETEPAESEDPAVDFSDFFDEDEPDFAVDMESEETDMDDTMEYPEDEYMEQTFEDGPVDGEEPETGNPAAEPGKKPRRRERKESEDSKVTLPKLAVPNIFTKFFDLYFAPLLNKNALEEPVDPNNPRRRRKKSKVQIFKEVYLPPILACVCLILVLSFVIGAISNAIDQKQADDAHKQNEEIVASNAAAEAAAEYQRIMDEAAELAAGYDYETAIEKLDSFSGDMTQYPELGAKRSEYASAQTSLVAHQDPSLIPNLSFHVLIADPVRAFADQELGGKYNRNFVTVDEFTKILNDLYNNGYVLVDFDSFTESSTGTNGNELFFSDPILLPADKKPIMITETLANYLEYMVDGNDDGVADAQGAGFANKLVVQNGEIKAEYITADGQTLVGDYDLVPILESFIKEHPDFSYRGARATVAVCGKEGIFGYRINSSYVATKGTAYQEEQIAGAKEVVQALRDKGYTLACYTFDNVAYGELSVAQIQADLQQWTSQITPVIGQVDTLVFAQSSNIQDYGGNAYTVLYQTGFRYFVSNGTSAWAEVNNTYVRQNRLMVTGNSMAYNPSWFTGIFDCAAILDVNTRGNVPN